MKRRRYIREMCCGMLLLGILNAFCVAGPARTKVKIDASEFDRRLLLERLNSNHGSLVLDDKDPQYIIHFSIEQSSKLVAINGIAGENNQSNAIVEVQDSAGKVLFRFKREGRGTDKGATNSAAKEIIKRLRTISSGT